MKILLIDNSMHHLKWSSSPFLTDILSCEQRKTSGGYWHKHKLQGAVYYSNLDFRKSILRAINSPCPQQIKNSNNNKVIAITALQRDK